MIRLLATLLLCSAAARAGDDRHEFERGLMGTRFVITCHGGDEATAKAAADEAFTKGEEINAVASDYIADSELLSLSKVPVGKPVKVSPLLFDLLDQSLRFAKLTEGRFDPTLGPLTKLWRESRRRGKLPDPATLNAARAASGWRHLKLDAEEKTVTLEVPGMRLDLGGIAKGYAADAMFAILKRRGFPATCIAAGGDLRLGDPPPGKTGWTVGMRTLAKDSTSGELQLANCAVSTSGDLQQFVEIGGTRYAHIIDPATGLGMTTHFAVTVVAKDATSSDAFDTSAYVAGLDQAERLALKWGATRVVVTRP